MLYTFGFDRLGVVLSDIFFKDPQLDVAEQGVRLEFRLLERGELRGSVYSATPIAVDRPLWRVDLLETLGNPGSLDHAHHHPRFRGWEPGRRNFVEEMTSDPFGWLSDRLADPKAVLDDAGVEPGTVPDHDLVELQQAAPEIVDAARRLLDRVRAGDLGQPPGDDVEQARVSWL